MMHLLAVGVITVGESVALSLIAKVTIVTAFAMVAGWLARHRRAAVRHLIFAGAFAVIALFPAATAVIPAVPVRLLVMPAIADTAPATQLNRPVEAGRFVAGGPSESRVSGRTWPVLSTAPLLSIVWLTGVIGCLVPVAL